MKGLCKRGQINRTCGLLYVFYSGFLGARAVLFRSRQTERITRVTLILEKSTSVELKFLSQLIGEQSYHSNLVSKPRGPTVPEFILPDYACL